jgi:uncharacterized protein
VIVISNSSPLIALSSIDRLDVLACIFEKVYIPDAVYHETVTQNHVPHQKRRIQNAIDAFVEVVSPKTQRDFIRRLGSGEQGVLNLAIELTPDLVLIDDKKARNEAKTLNLPLGFTTDILKWAEQRQIIASYAKTVQQLAQHKIYLPGALSSPVLTNMS